MRIYTEVAIMLWSKQQIISAIIFGILEGITHKYVITFCYVCLRLRLDTLYASISEVFIPRSAFNGWQGVDDNEVSNFIILVLSLKFPQRRGILNS